MKVGEEIKCNGMNDMWNTKNVLERIGIYADPEFPICKFTLKVWKIKESKDDSFGSDTGRVSDF